MMERHGKAVEEDLDDYNIPVDTSETVDNESVYEDITSLRGKRELELSWRVSSLFCCRVASATRVWQYG